VPPWRSPAMDEMEDDVPKAIVGRGYDKPHRPWLRREDEVLETLSGIDPHGPDAYTSMEIERVARQLDRSARAVRDRLRLRSGEEGPSHEELRRDNGARSHTRWTSADEAMLVRLFDLRWEVERIAGVMGRSVVAIETRLVRLGRWE
jgi:hypothetical protein